jgi:hypothetical protein
LKAILHKLLLNFTWWVNRKDPNGRNVFEGGFLGLDNIGVFDRSAPLPTGGHLEQADGAAWMALYSQVMLQISIELALEDPTYSDMAIKFFEHFVWIAARTQFSAADRRKIARPGSPDGKNGMSALGSKRKAWTCVQPSGAQRCVPQ